MNTKKYTNMNDYLNTLLNCYVMIIYWYIFLKVKNKIYCYFEWLYQNDKTLAKMIDILLMQSILIHFLFQDI